MDLQFRLFGKKQKRSTKKEFLWFDFSCDCHAFYLPSQVIVVEKFVLCF